MVQLDYMPFDPTVKRTEGTVRCPDGRVMKITKGAPNIILNLCHNKDEIRAVSSPSSASSLCSVAVV